MNSKFSACSFLRTSPIVLIGLLFFFSLISGVSGSVAHAGFCSYCKIEVPNTHDCSACRAATYCGAECQKNDWASHKSKCSPLRPFTGLLGEVEIKESTIPNAGLGLFAKRKFTKGENIAVYYGSEIKEQPSQYSLLLNPYVIQSSKGRYTLGQVDPIPPAHLGAQFTNDPFMDEESYRALLSIDCRAVDSELIKTTLRKYISAVFSSINLSNAALSETQSSFQVFVASRRIKKGEEIFYPYGMRYWVNIPLYTCQKKGLPLGAVQIHMAASEVAEEVSRRLGKRPVEIYEGYATLQSLKSDFATFSRPRNKLPLKLAYILFPAEMFQIEIDDGKAFVEMLTELDVIEKLEEISQKDNHEFYSPKKGVFFHPLSRQLWINMIQWERKKGTPVFTVVARVHAPNISKDELLRILGAEVTE
jgi:hypothetical protein